MALVEVRTFNGIDFTVGNYEARFEAANTYAVTASIDQRRRRNLFPTVSGTARDAIELQLTVYRPSSSGVTLEDFHLNVRQAFDPELNSKGPRYLTGVSHDWATEVRAPCYVRSIAVRPNTNPTNHVYDIVLVSPQPYWESTSLLSVTAGPATNPGNTAVFPTIALTTTNHVKRYPVTVADNTGRGLIAYPVVAALNDSDATNDSVFVYINGVSVPTWVDNSGASDSRVWFLVDCPADGSNLDVDVVIASGWANPIGGTLPASGFDFANSTNTSWTWNDWSVSDHAARCGVWRLARSGEHVSGTFFRVSEETSGNLTFEGSAGFNYVNDADGIVLPIGVEAASSDALTGMVRAMTRTGGNGAMRIDYRVAGSARWINAWEVVNPVSSTVSTAVDLDGAVEIRVYLWVGSAANALELDLSGTVALALANTPTVTVGSPGNMDHYNGTFVVGGYTLTFDHLIVPDGTLTIDCGAKSIVTSVDGPQYGDDTPSFSDLDRWAVLEPGSTAIVNSLTGAAFTMQWRGGFT